MWNLGCRKIDEYIFWQVVRFPWRILSFQDSLSSGVSESTVTIAKPLKWALARRHPWLSPRLSTPGSPIQDRGDHNTRLVVTSHRGDDEYHCLFTSRQRKLPSPQLQPILKREMIGKVEWITWICQVLQVLQLLPRDGRWMWKVEIDEGTLNLLAALFTLGAAEKQISETNFVREPGKS